MHGPVSNDQLSSTRCLQPTQNVVFEVKAPVVQAFDQTHLPDSPRFGIVLRFHRLEVRHHGGKRISITLRRTAQIFLAAACLPRCIRITLREVGRGGNTWMDEPEHSPTCDTWGSAVICLSHPSARFSRGCDLGHPRPNGDGGTCSSRPPDGSCSAEKSKSARPSAAARCRFRRARWERSVRSTGPRDLRDDDERANSV